ncbi:MAG TPA: hypothetical protein DCM48_01300, partial [Thalassospira sp.]|nr:hypothetical protein [Thalassospira sp.]
MGNRYSLSDFADIYRSALNLYEAGRYAEAEESCQRMIRSFPQAAEAMHL